MGRITVDARLLGAAGIGRYLEELLPRLIRDMERPFTLLGDRGGMERRGLGGRDGVQLVDAQAPIYSMAEQLELARRAPQGGGLFWAPHYNIPLLHRGPLVATVHDVFHLACPDLVRGAHRRAYARVMFAALVRRARAILCDSAFTADELVRHTGASRARLRVVRLGVDPFWSEPMEQGTQHPRPYFLALGNVKPHKNLRRLVQAFARVADRVPHDLVVIGRVEGFLTGDSGVVEEGARLGDRVRFTGFLEDRSVRGYLAHASALVFPSLYEGFGLPALEAMAAGCPVIASTAGSLPEVCGDAALFCDPLRVDDIADQLLRVAGEPGLRDELRGRGRERARRFCWEASARETREVLESVLAS